ncbi:MAG: TraM recognition domain-containing protein, partial [Pseudomonadota bacterium]
NRRVLVVLLPALEKSPEELSNLGKVIIASLKAMMAAGLGDDVEGSYKDIIQRKPTNAPTPFLCILDEYGYYAVKGFAVVPAQARSLGFSTVFAGQDLPAFQKASKEEAASIGANTNIKICMKLEDPLETWEFFHKTAGEAYVTKVDSFQTRSESITNTYMDTRSASAEKRARIDLLDLKEQREGEGHIFFKSKIVRAKMFYANPPPAALMRLNHFVKVEPPPARKLVELEGRLNKFQQVVENEKFFADTHTDSEDINLIVNALKHSEREDSIERAVDVLFAYEDRNAAVEPENIEEVIGTEALNVFTRLRVPTSGPQLLIDDVEKFCAPLLLKTVVREQIEFVERLIGKPEKEAINISTDIVRDMELATQYPPAVHNQPTGPELSDVVYQLVNRIATVRDTAKTVPPATS